MMDRRHYKNLLMYVAREFILMSKDSYTFENGGEIMPCEIECSCPKSECPNYKKCCACVLNHKETDSLPYCLFPNNEGSKSVANYYIKLKERFEK